MTDTATFGETGAAATAAVFLSAMTSHLVGWLIATLAVIICDLVVGIRKAAIMNEPIRFSHACRATMGKIVTYFAFVFMACAVEQAAGGALSIDRWACLLVCFIEGCSIVGNILKPKGVRVDLGKLITKVAGKVTHIDGLDDVIKEDKDE